MDLKHSKVQVVKSRSSSYIKVFLFASVLCVACNTKRRLDNNQSAPEYAVMTIVPRSTTLFSDYPATIEGQQNVEIRPKVDGYMEKIYVDEGATVSKGQLLFRISAPQYEQAVRTAQAEIFIAEADVNAAQMEVNKVRPLVDGNIISKYELESALYSLQSKQGALAQAHARLANARTDLGYTIIASPVNGVVGKIPYKIGSLVSANTAQPLTMVSNIGKIYAWFSVNEKQSLEFARNLKGSTFEERVATFPPVILVLANGSELSERGKIEAASGLINTETGSFNLRATFFNPGSIVRSGSSGTIRIPRPVNSALIIPQKVTYELQGKKFVYLLESTGTIRSVEIKVIENSNGQFFVVEKGLEAGDRVVIEGVATLREGATIKPKMVDADSVYHQLVAINK